MQTEMEKTKETYIEKLSQDLSDFINSKKEHPYATYHGSLDEQYVYLLTIKKLGKE